MEQQLIAFLNAKAPEIERLSGAASLAYWRATTTGEAKYEQEYIRRRQTLLKFLSDRAAFAGLKTIKDGERISDPLLKRQLTILFNMYSENQVDELLLENLVYKETEIESCFTNFRALIDGKQVSDNDLSQILREELDSLKRQGAWEASKQIGLKVSAGVLELVELRNTIANNLGFAHYQQMALSLAEIDPERLFAVLDELRRLTDEPFRQIKAAVDARLRQRYSCDTLMPWHYSDPFFQEPPISFGLSLNAYFSDKDIVKLVSGYYQALGFEVGDILANSDLYERPGKNQHAYCTDIDRKGDIRILCNLRNDEYWVGTLLHELGHAVYDKYHDRDLPYLLRTHAHTLTTEAVAMFMEQGLKNPLWLERVAGAPVEEVENIREQLQFYSVLSQLVFIRWALVVVYFERELYANPGQDLDKLWWDLVEQLQYVTRPPGRTAPDWAAKIHIAAAPVYYQNYILGSLTAAQIGACLERDLGSPLSLPNPQIGSFLRDRIFKPGARLSWEELIKSATGEELTPSHFVNQCLKKLQW